MDIIKIIYNSLTFLKNINEFYKEENEKLNLIFNIKLLSFYNIILENNKFNKKY